MHTFPPLPVPRPVPSGPPRGLARRAAAVLALLAATAVGVAWAQPASALVTESDEFTIRSVGYDVGNLDGDFSGGEPDNPAVVTWDHAWFGVVPSVDGVMHYESVSGECTRVRLISYDAAQASLGSDYSDRKCANTDGHETRPILEGSFPLSGRPGAASVEVILQHETPNGWARVGAIQEADYGPTIDTDDFKINGEELNFGNGAFVDADPHGYPADKAQIRWSSSTGQIRPSVTGFLYVEDGDSLCTRVRVRFLEADGTELDRQFSPELCPAGDAPESVYVQFSSFAHNEIDDVQVTLQKVGGSGTWESDGSKMIQLN